MFPGHRVGSVLDRLILRDEQIGGALPGETPFAHKTLARTGSRLAFDPDTFGRMSASS